jgi:hypothetical protein
VEKLTEFWNRLIGLDIPLTIHNDTTRYVSVKVVKMAEIEEAANAAQPEMEKLRASFQKLSDFDQIYILGQAEGIRAAQERKAAGSAERKAGILGIVSNPEIA